MADQDGIQDNPTLIMPPLSKPLRASKFWDDGIDPNIAAERAARMEREEQLRAALSALEEAKRLRSQDLPLMQSEVDSAHRRAETAEAEVQRLLLNQRKAREILQHALGFSDNFNNIKWAISLLQPPTERIGQVHSVSPQFSTRGTLACSWMRPH